MIGEVFFKCFVGVIVNVLLVVGVIGGGLDNFDCVGINVVVFGFFVLDWEVDGIYFIGFCFYQV